MSPPLRLERKGLANCLCIRRPESTDFRGKLINKFYVINNFKFIVCVGDQLIRHVRHVGTCRAMSELSFRTLTQTLVVCLIFYNTMSSGNSSEKKVEKCCLCKSEFERNGKTVKLNGRAASARESREVLSYLLEDVYKTRFDSTELCSDKLFLCLLCTNDIHKLKLMMSSMEKLRSTIANHLQKYVPHTSCTPSNVHSSSSGRTNETLSIFQTRKRRRDTIIDHDEVPPSQYEALEPGSDSQEHTTPVRHKPSGVAVSS